jgi:hypothetical protein
MFVCQSVAYFSAWLVGWLVAYLVGWFCIICLVGGMGGKWFHNSCSLGFSECIYL